MIRICIIVECSPKSKAYLCGIRAFLVRHGMRDSGGEEMRRQGGAQGRAAAKKTRRSVVRLGRVKPVPSLKEGNVRLSQPQ